MTVLLRHLRPCLHVRLISSSLFSSPSLKPQNPLSLSPLSSLFLNSRGFVGYPRKYDAGVFRVAGSYRDVHEMADADADAPTDSSEQKKEAALKAIVSCCKSTFVFCRELTGSFEANLTGLQAKTLAGFPGVAMLEELKANLVIEFGV